MDPAAAPSLTRQLQQAIRRWHQVVRRRAERFAAVDRGSSDAKHSLATVPMLPVNQVTGILHSGDPDLHQRAAWQSNGTWLPTYKERAGVVDLSRNWRFGRLAQRIQLPSDHRCAVVVEARIDIRANRYPTCTCSSAITNVVVEDKRGREESIYQGSVSSDEGWKTVALDLSRFAGQEVVLTLRGEHGGRCQFICFGRLLIDRLYVAELRDGHLPRERIKEELRALGYVE